MVLEHLESDSDMAIRAAAHIARLLQGVPVPLPPDLDTRVAADAVRQGAELGSLRHVARTAPSEDRRLAAALALALIQDEVAHRWREPIRCLPCVTGSAARSSFPCRTCGRTA